MRLRRNKNEPSKKLAPPSDWAKEDKKESNKFSDEERANQKIMTRKKKETFMLSGNDMFLLDTIMLSRGLDFESEADRGEAISQMIRAQFEILPKPKAEKFV